jgi:hypothetical protein
VKAVYPFRLDMLWLLTLLPFTASAQGSVLFDSHSHFKQEDAATFSHTQIVAKMDRENISHMVLVGQPAELIQPLYRFAPERIIPFLGLYDDDSDKAEWMFDTALPSRLRQQLAEGHYEGIGEIHLFTDHRHSPVFREILALASQHSLPVLFHGDAEVVDQIFTWHPELVVIWAHLGTKPEPDLLRIMLRRYPQNLYIDTSVRDERILVDGLIMPAFHQLFMDYPDRFLVAIDTFYTPRWQALGDVATSIRAWLTQLPESVAQKLAHDNARQLFGR